jgi:hypothetical protein
MQELNIVELIEGNPITKLSQVYNGKLLTKIKDTFTGFEQQLFVSSFYCYLNYNKNTDFVVDLDNIWKWIGFSQKIDAKRLLEKHFCANIDYKLALGYPKASVNQENIKSTEEKWGGHNKQTFLLTIKCFKSMCLKAQTKKASEIHEYYMKMEEVLHDIVEEETDELRLQIEQKQLQIEQKDNIILEIKETSEQEKISLQQANQKTLEAATIFQFPVNTECIYIGTIDNTNAANEKLIKFGHTNDLKQRLRDHRKTYENFQLITAFRVQNKIEIEGLIKSSVKIKRQIRHIEINGKNKLEIIAYDLTNFTIEKLTSYINEIIHSKTYSIDNFNKLIIRNEELEEKNRELEKENRELKEQKSIKILSKSKSAITNAETQFVYVHDYKSAAIPSVITNDVPSVITNAIVEPKSDSISDYIPDDKITVFTTAKATILTPDLITDNIYVGKFNEFIDTMCIVRFDVEETSVDMESQLRIWLKQKPQKEVFHAFKQYLDTRFKSIRFNKKRGQEIQYVHGYKGLKLKPIEYKKQFIGNAVETFLFEMCEFSPSGKVFKSCLLNEYKTWNITLNKATTDENVRELNDYLFTCDYVVKSIIWSDGESNEGYYGISLKTKGYTKKFTGVTGKKVEKVELETGYVLQTWDTVAKAAVSEHLTTAKLSRGIKDKTTFNDYYYRFHLSTFLFSL